MSAAPAPAAPMLWTSDMFVNYLKKTMYAEMTPFMKQEFVHAVSVAVEEFNLPAKPFVDNFGMDVDMRALWPPQHDREYKTTLLLSAVECRKTELVRELLTLGADVNAVDDGGFGIIDALLWGHTESKDFDPYQVKQCKEIWAAIKLHNPKRIIDASTRDQKWQYATTAPEIHALFMSCELRRPTDRGTTQ